MPQESDVPATACAGGLGSCQCCARTLELAEELDYLMGIIDHYLGLVDEVPVGLADFRGQRQYLRDSMEGEVYDRVADKAPGLLAELRAEGFVIDGGYEPPELEDCPDGGDGPDD